MITLQLYENGDSLKIKDPVEPFAVLGGFDEVAARGIAVTAIENGKAMACGGITFLSKDEGLVWVKMSKGCAKKPFKWARGIKEAFDIMVKSVGDVKISTYILSEFYKGVKLARLINLKCSGETEEYKGNTYLKYSMVI